MQTSIPNWARPVNVTVVVEHESVSISKILADNGFATSRNMAKQMVKNGEVWIINKNISGDFLIEQNLEKVTEDIFVPRFIFTKNNSKLPHDILFIGSKLETAMCHRITLV